MIIKIKRIKQFNDNTIGLFFLNKIYECFCLEDLPNDPKIYGKTRIPAGEYKITFRTEGRLHEKYAKLFPSFHKGMLWIRDIPNFEYVYIHIGNKAEHTDGCPLTGDAPSVDFKSLVNSTVAYTRLYKKVMNEKDIKIIVEDE